MSRSVFASFYLDADGETFALPEGLLPVVVVVLLHHGPPAQHWGRGADCAVADVLTGWSMDLGHHTEEPHCELEASEESGWRRLARCHRTHLCIGGLNGSRQGLHAVNALCGVAEARLDGHVSSGSLLLHVCILGSVEQQWTQS